MMNARFLTLGTFCLCFGELWAQSVTPAEHVAASRSRREERQSGPRNARSLPTEKPPRVNDASNVAPFRSPSDALAGTRPPADPPEGASDCCTEHFIPGCDNAACEADVCALDDFCCTSRWDVLCVQMAEVLCCPLCNPCPGDCLGCPPGAIPENEPDCGIPVDTVNGGCNGVPLGGNDCCVNHLGPGCADADCQAAVCAAAPACCAGAWLGFCPVLAEQLCGNLCTGPLPVSPIQCGDTVCGTAALASGIIRDTDWWEITVGPGDTLITWSVTAEFPVIFDILDGACAELFPEVEDYAMSCETGSISKCVPAGTYRLFVAPLGSVGSLFLDDVACGAGYTASVSCEPCAYSNPCSTSQNDCCLPSPNDTGACNNPQCCSLMCAAGPECCEGVWTSGCASLAELFEECHCQCGGVIPANENCCETSPYETPGCIDAGCQDCVCGADPFCCTTGWDTLCVASAYDQCASACACTDAAPCASGPNPLDCCADAVPIFNGQTAFSTAGATTDGQPHALCWQGIDSGVNQDIWYHYTAPQTGTVHIEVCPTYFAKIAVYEGCGACPPTAADLLACSEYDCAFNPMLVSVTQGTCYTARIGGLFTQSGSGTINIALDPGCNCCDGGNPTQPGCDDATCQACVCGIDPFCCNVAWDDTCDNQASQNCAASCTCCDPTEGGGDGTPPPPQDGGDPPEGGSGPPPPNDNCADSIVIQTCQTPFTTVGATTDGPAHPQCLKGFGDSQVNQDVWFDWVADVSGPVSVNTVGTPFTFDTKLAVYNGCECPVDPDSLLCCNDDHYFIFQWSEVKWEAVAGQCYKIRAGGFFTSAGEGVLNLSSCNDNNPCTDDVCDPISGQCVFINDDTNACDDANVCNGVGYCQAGVCVNGPDPNDGSDLDGDCDVDLYDVALMQVRFTGSNP